MLHLAGKVAVITGAGSGIGLAMAQVFAGAGMRLVLADVDDRALAQAAEQFGREGVPALPVRTDVTDAAAVRRLADEGYRAYGAVHLLCNNAGVISEGAPVWEESDQNWDWVLGVNFRGVLHGVQQFVPRMLAAGEPGHIVNTASLAGLTSRPLMGAYNVSKHAVVALSECLYAELRLTTDRMGVSVVCPAWAKTRLGEATRNRPAAADGADRSYGLADALKRVVAEGTPPEVIAAQVLEAVQADRFWVLTNPEFDSSIRSRFEGMLARENPAVRDLRLQSTPLK